MELLELSGKKINIENLELDEKEFFNLFENHSPYKNMDEIKRKEILKSDYKIFKKVKNRYKKEGAE